MIECVQNHTPEVMVIDEIGRSMEVQAARTSKNRGVRMIASAHGNLRSLMKNKDLIGLIGGHDLLLLLKVILNLPVVYKIEPLV